MKTDPDTSDYLFNFNSKNALWILQPEQSQVHLMAALKFFEEAFLNTFTDDFKKEVFPFQIILADSVVYTGSMDVSEKWRPDSIFITEHRIFFNISEHTLNFSEERKEKLSFDWLLTFFSKYCIELKKDGLKIDDIFYTTSQKYYGTWRSEGSYGTHKQLEKEDWYERGFLSIQGSGGSAEWGYFTHFPNYTDSDFRMFFTAMCTMDHDELMAIVAKYPRVATRYNCVKTALETIGVNYRTMGYHAKK